MSYQISLGSPAIDESEIAAVTAALESKTLSTGEVVREFEHSCQRLTGTNHAAAVSSGSTALELALLVSPIDEGSGIVVSPYNCGAVLYSILRADLVPVFADIEPSTYDLDPDEARSAIAAADIPVEGLLAVDMYGQPCDRDELDQVATEYDLTLIEDVAQSIGAIYKGQKVGSFGELAIGSFGATKNITTAEGGVVVSDDETLIESVKQIRSNTNDPESRQTYRSARLSDIHAAIGREQIEKYNEILDRKRSAAEIYDDLLNDVLNIPTTRNQASNVYHGYPVLTPKRDDLFGYLENRRIESAAVYDTPLYEYPQIELDSIDPGSSFPNTERVSVQVLLLPIHGSLTADQARRVGLVVQSFFE